MRSETLEDLLKSGTLKGIQLIKDSVVNDSQDGIPFITTARSEVILTPPPKVQLQLDEQLIGVRNVIKLKKENYDSLKVTVDLNGMIKTNEIELDLLADKMNLCPRKCLGFKMPKELFIQQYKNDCRTWS